MPLPSALQAKLQKRGLINQTGSKPVETEKDYKGVLLCPNKYNIFHNCTSWCQTHWKGFVAPDGKYTSNVRRMLEKYPLPHNWTEIFDKGIGRYYYWNMETNMVSWLPPRHPKAEVTEPAAKYRMRIHTQNHNDPEKDKKRMPKPEKSDRVKEKHHDKRHHRHDDRGHGNRKKSRRDDLDPMDPAAYSDIPRGSWSDGLESSKSKADSTAQGALFQQRPYPPPGSVLAANKSKKK